MEKCYLCCVLLLIIKFCCAFEEYEENDEIELHKCVTTLILRMEIVTATDATLVNVDVGLVKELHLLPHPVRYISRSFYWPNDTLFNDVYVIQCKDFFMFAQGLDLVRRDPYWNPRAKFIIITEHPTIYLQDISDFLVHNHIFNVVLVSYSEDRSIVLYTFGHQLDECDRPVRKKLELQSRCSEIDNTDIDKIFTSDKAPTLRGCHVKFVSHNYWPFVSFSGKYTIEEYLLKLISQYEGITVELVDFGSVENFGSRLENFTYTGMLHEIETYHVEGAVGGFHLTFNRTSNLDFLNPYIVDHYKIVIPRAEFLRKWPTVIKQFGFLTLLFLFGTFCVICVVATFMGLFKKQSTHNTSRDILIVWGYFFNNICHKQIAKSGLPYRMVLLSVLIFVFILSYTTQALLLSATSHPIRANQPNSPEEIFSNYELLANPTLHVRILKNPGLLFIKLAKDSCINTLDCMVKITKNGDRRLFTVTSDIYHQSYVWMFADESGEPKMYTIRESILTTLITMYLRRGSPLAAPFNRLVERVLAAGLVDNFFKKLNFAERLKYKFRYRKQQPQSMTGLTSVFTMLICGYCISVISFIFEYLSKV